MATARAFDPSRLDVAAVAAAGASFAGEWPLATLARLAAASAVPAAATSAPVTWQVRGELARIAGAGLVPALHVAADAAVTLECQRCLGPIDMPLNVDRRLFFVAGEDLAAALDAESDDDILALQPRLDLRWLIEEELLLALPLVPRHEVCTEPLPQPMDEEVSAAAKVHPFASLAAWKRGEPPR